MSYKRSVLIIDSNPDELMQLICFMEDQFETVIAPEQGNYIHFAEHMCPDIIFIDDMISEPNCYELCRGLKSISALKYAPIVLMSDLTDEDLNEEIDRLNIADYIRKPINKNELLKKTETLLSFHQTS